MLLSVYNLKILLKFPEFYNFQLEKEFIFQMCLILLFLSLFFFCCPCFLMLCIDIYGFFLKPYKLSFGFFLGAISLPLPTKISALQTRLSDDNSRDGVLTPQKWNSNTRVAVG